ASANVGSARVKSRLFMLLSLPFCRSSISRRTGLCALLPKQHALVPFHSPHANHSRPLPPPPKTRAASKRTASTSTGSITQRGRDTNSKIRDARGIQNAWGTFSKFVMSITLSGVNWLTLHEAALCLFDLVQHLRAPSGVSVRRHPFARGFEQLEN